MSLLPVLAGGHSARSLRIFPLVHIFKVAVLMAQVWKKPYSSGLRLARTRTVSLKSEDHTAAAEGQV